jgi:hypothetical protein
MLKFFFWLLVLANGALLAYRQGYLDPWFASSHEPGRIARQLNADKIKLLPADGKSATPPASGTAAPPTAAAVAATDPSEDWLPTGLALASQKTEAQGCTEIGNFNEIDARRFDAQLAQLNLGKRLSRRPVVENLSHIVYMPPQGSKENADKKVNELRRLGVTDFFVIQDNPALRWGISLGIFSTEQAAEDRLAELTAKGVRTARLGVRNAVSKVAFQLRGLDAATRTKLDAIKAAYPQQQERGCT